MKSITEILTVIFLTFMVQVGIAQISGSAHDFSNQPYSGGEFCIVCHTPHNSMTGINAPLWNHELTQSTFTLYSSATIDATDIGQPDGNSKLCLSCHDGTVAIDNFGGAQGNSDFMGSVSPKNLHTDLSNDHPVSFTYDAALANTDGGLFNPGTQTSGLGGTIASDLLFNNKLQCASCHDVHNGSGFDNLLVISNVGSALCLTCHNK